MLIDSILLVDDETLFHLVFEDACNLLDITLQLMTVDSTDAAEVLCRKWQGGEIKRPDCVFVDLNIVGSSVDGIELVRRINHIYGNGVVVGIISSSSDKKEISKAIAAGAQFWIVKSDEIEPRLEKFKADYEGYKNKTLPFKVYA
jgi:CheY-like chemotaxis protein